MHPRAKLSLTLMACLAALGSGCATRSGSPDNEPTLASLATQRVNVEKDAGVKADPERAMRAYREFVAVAPNAPQRAEVLRRLGDLEMERVEARIAEGRANGEARDWREAIALHQSVLKQYPNQPGNDRVLYQLARAHELGGELEQALAMLDRLVKEHPQSRHVDEANFRRGELLFTARQYAQAERAYTTVLERAPTVETASAFRERSLYMKGWSQYKQARLEDALASFFGVLDLKLAGAAEEGDLADLKTLTRADRELLEDTFRVTSLSLQALQGAATIETYTTTPARRAFEYHVHRQLAELYLKQERVKDAADTLSAFTRRNPLHAQAPQLQARVIDIYQGSGFAALALEAKKDHVRRYGVGSEYQRANPKAWETTAQPLVKTHLAELAQHHHALAQRQASKDDARKDDAQEAVQWYRALLTSFPKDEKAAANRFLLAELLQSQGQLAQAAVEFDTTAYGHAAHVRSADAGYAAVLVRGELEKQAAQSDAATKAKAERATVDSGLRFADAFGNDARAPAVLTHAADKLFALGDGATASTTAARILAVRPEATAAQRRVAHTVLAHTAFDRQAFAEAEQHYTQALALVDAQDAMRNNLVERQAAAIYKQGEAARQAGRTTDAAAMFARVASVAPGASVRANAQVDAAAALIATKDWAGAAAQLEDFRQRFPKHALSADVTAKLAVVYTERQQWGAAASEFERLSADARDPKIAREAQWHAAELHEKAGDKPAAMRSYERYVAQHPRPLAPAMEARWRLIDHAQKNGQSARELMLARELVQAEASGGDERSDRSKALAALATLRLAQPALEAYRKVALVEPLQRTLAQKKARLEDVLKAYAAASAYGVGEAVTAATFHTAELYQDFGKALLASQRPKKLSKLELEQYNVLLEEQAFPFEEKAIELHETNARRTTGGLYDAWVKKSFAALRDLRPVRYGKAEKQEGVIHVIR